MRPGLFLLTLVVVCAPAAQAQISLRVQADVATGPSGLSLLLLVKNEGKEAAHDIAAKIVAAIDSTHTGPAVLEPGQSHEFVETTPLDSRQPGTYPIMISVRYTDANAYPFTAVLCTTYSVGQSTQAEIFGNLRIDPLQDDGFLLLRVKNLLPETVRATVALLVARELTVGEHPDEISLQPDGERSLRVSLHNFSALAGSLYPVYAILQYQRDGHHYTALVQEQVEIQAPVPLFARYRNWIAGTAGLLLIAGFAWIVIQRRKRDSSPPPSRPPQ